MIPENDGPPAPCIPFEIQAEIARIDAEIRAIRLLGDLDRESLRALVDRHAGVETSLVSRILTLQAQVEAYREEIKGLTRWLL